MKRKHFLQLIILIPVAIATVNGCNRSKDKDDNGSPKPQPTPTATATTVPPIAEFPPLVTLLQPGHCDVAGNADELTQTIHRVVSEMLGPDPAPQDVAAVVQLQVRRGSGDAVVYTGQIERRLRLVIEAPANGVFAARLGSSGQPDENTLLYLALTPNEKSETIRTDTITENLLAAFSAPERIGTVATVSEPPAIPVLQARLLDLSGIPLGPEDLTPPEVKITREGNKTTLDLLLRSKPCDLEFSLGNGKPVLRRISVH